MARRTILPILAVQFVGTLGYSIVVPFLVFLVVRLGGNAVVYGVVGATYSAFQLVGAPLLGRWSDRVGRKRVLLVSQLGTLAAWGIFLAALALPVRTLLEVSSGPLGAFTVTVPLLVLAFARALDGLTGGNVSVANAYLADLTDEANRSRDFGRMAVASNLGFVLGPALAGVLGATAAGSWLPVAAAFAISGVAALLVLFALPDAAPCRLEGPPETSSVRDVLGGDQKECYRLEGEGDVSTRRLLALPGVARLLALQGMVFVAFNLYYVAFPVYAATGLEWDLGRVGAFFSFLGLMMAVVQGPVLARAGKRWGDGTLIVGGSLLLALGFALVVSDRTPVLYAAATLIALGNGLMWPALLATLSRATGPELQGGVQGLSGSVSASASIVGLLAGGALYELLGPRVFLLSAAVTLAVAALAALPPATPTPETA